jgi:hypothetical protein
MTKTQVCTAVMEALRVAREALTGEVKELPEDANPFDAISGFDSLASTDVTTTICASIGLSDTTSNPFLQNGGRSTIGQIVDAFCTLAGITED